MQLPFPENWEPLPRDERVLGSPETVFYSFRPKFGKIGVSLLLVTLILLALTLRIILGDWSIVAKVCVGGLTGMIAVVFVGGVRGMIRISRDVRFVLWGDRLEKRVGKTLAYQFPYADVETVSEEVHGNKRLLFFCSCPENMTAVLWEPGLLNFPESNYLALRDLLCRLVATKLVEKAHSPDTAEKEIGGEGLWWHTDEMGQKKCLIPWDQLTVDLDERGGALIRDAKGNVLIDILPGDENAIPNLMAITYLKAHPSA